MDSESENVEILILTYSVRSRCGNLCEAPWEASGSGPGEYLRLRNLVLYFKYQMLGYFARKSIFPFLLFIQMNTIE